MVKLLIISIIASLLTIYSGQRGDEKPTDDGSWADSLVAAATASDSLRVCHLAAQQSIFADTVLKYSLCEIKLAIRLKDTAKIADAYSTLAWAYGYYGNRDSARAIYTREYELLKKTKDTMRVAKTLYNLACNYNDVNEFSKSLQYYLQALVLFEQQGDTRNMALIQRDLAIRDVNMRQYPAANEKIRKAIELDRKINDSTSLANDLYALILMQFNETKNSSTLSEIQQLDIKADSIGMIAANIKDNLDRGRVMFEYYHIKAILYGKYYLLDGQHWRIDSAYSFCDRALSYQYEVKDVDKIVSILLQKAQTAYFEKNSLVGINITDQLQQRYMDSLSLNKKMELYKVTSQCHEAARDFEKAYIYLCEYIKCYIQYVSSLNVMENAAFAASVKIYELESKQSIENEQHSIQMEQQRRITTLIIIILIIGSILLVLTFRALLQKRTNVRILNDKNLQLSRQQEEIVAQRNTIEEQRQASERANLIMYQSIRYARHIQSAALPSEDHIRRIFPDHFVYYEPKDIVSGDFYYATQNAGLDIFVLADCTGHGVPGAFLSMLGISAIKELLKNPEIDIMPGIILDMMREYVKQALANDEDVAEAIARGEESFATADGMDMSIVAYDKYNHILRFAGAYQSLYIARDGEIIRLKGDRMPVGRHINESESFHTQFFDTQKGDMIYMSSDGIVSQIGFSGVKFMSKRLMDFFKSNYALPCETQKRNIANIMNDWLFGSTQIDDLSLVGIRITE
ncbi:MAG: SpoIIE family protein phosphatase [Bacteroidales bacterium]|nr:SpoIIE family protein phosphatase [Bacteroidales bacterium]